MCKSSVVNIPYDDYLFIMTMITMAYSICI